MTPKEKLRKILNIPIYPHLSIDPLDVVCDYLWDNDVRVKTKARWENNCCSNCGNRALEKEYQAGSYKSFPFKSAFCPFCGADMRESLKTGYWQDNADSWICSICGYESNNPNHEQFGPSLCPNCHSKME